MTTDFSLQLYSGGLDVLYSIIIGYNIQPDDGGSNLPYRRLSDIKKFFTDIGIPVIDESSREKTARATLSSINSTPKLKTCIESALLPAHFLKVGNPDEAFDELLPHLEAVGWTLNTQKRKLQSFLREAMNIFLCLPVGRKERRCGMTHNRIYGLVCLPAFPT